MRRRPKANTPAQASVARIQVAILLSSFLCEIQACGKAGQAKKYSDRLALKDADSHSRHAHFFQPVGCSFQHRLHPFPNTIHFHGIRPYASAVFAPVWGDGWGAALPRRLRPSSRPLSRNRDAPASLPRKCFPAGKDRMLNNLSNVNFMLNIFSKRKAATSAAHEKIFNFFTPDQFDSTAKAALVPDFSLTPCTWSRNLQAEHANFFL